MNSGGQQNNWWLSILITTSMHIVAVSTIGTDYVLTEEYHTIIGCLSCIDHVYRTKLYVE